MVKMFFGQFDFVQTITSHSSVNVANSTSKNCKTSVSCRLPSRRMYDLFVMRMLVFILFSSQLFRTQTRINEPNQHLPTFIWWCKTTGWKIVKCHLTLFSSPRVFVLSWLLEEEITFILRHCTQGLFVLIMPVSKQNNMVKWWQTREDVAVAVSMVRANWSFFNSTSICDLFTCDYKLPHRHVYYRKVPRDTFKKTKLD